MGLIAWLVAGECLAGALLLFAAYLNYQHVCTLIDSERAKGDWMIHFHERIWEFEGDGHGGSSPDCP